MNTNNGGGAFPLPVTTSNNGEVVCLSDYRPYGEGMTLRDYFAAHVPVDESDMPSTEGRCCELIGIASLPPESNVHARLMACAKIEAVIRGMKADAMIEEREKFLARTKSKA